MEFRCPQCGTGLPEGAPASFRALRVADLMTRNPVTVGPEDTLMRAFEVMRLHGIRRLPVVVGDRLLGILAEGDLKRAQPSILSDTEEQFNAVLEGTQVARIMIGEAVTVEAGASLYEAAQTLLTTKFGALPVLEAGRLVGILTDSDLIRCLAALLRPAG